MRIVQFERPAAGRRVGVVVNEKVHDVTSVNSDWKRITDVFQNAQSSGKRITEVLEEVLDTGQTVSFPRHGFFSPGKRNRGPGHRLIYPF